MIKALRSISGPEKPTKSCIEDYKILDVVLQCPSCLCYLGAEGMHYFVASLGVQLVHIVTSRLHMEPGET